LWKDPFTSFVLSDCGVYWDHLDADQLGFDRHCPDIAVLTGLANPQLVLNCDSYSVKTFGVLPRMIVEIVSRHVRENDTVKKLRDYHLVRIPLYIIVDREKSDDDWKIVPYQYTPRKYLKLATDERGRFWIDFLGIWLGVENKKVVCYDGETDAVIGDYLEITQQLQSAKQHTEAEKQRAESEKQAREVAEAKLKELEAELARLRGQ
jgi:Uma2 family endonuclease